MRAVVCRTFGSAELGDVDRPEPGGEDVLVRVRAASMNRVDWYGVVGRPYVGRVSMGLRKPRSVGVGVDFSGVVEAVGGGITRFKPGDEVFGMRNGAFAEYVLVPEDGGMAPKPASVTFEQAACVPVAGLTSLQGLRDHGKLRPGQHVLINGASGSVGTFAVQIAKALGGEVTAVCSTPNVDVAPSLGADHVIDYTREDFTRSGRRYDLVLDVAGSRSWRACKRVLNPEATFVIVGGPKTNRLLGPLSHVIKVYVAAVRASQKVVFFVAKRSREDLLFLGELLETGKLIPVIERRYELSETAEALRYMGEGHAQAKVVITV
jgi:NADPH:quinone reductase-like Zn-dependent oxidoreductase